jgi:hypothetical protein
VRNRHHALFITLGQITRQVLLDGVFAVGIVQRQVDDAETTNGELADNGVLGQAITYRQGSQLAGLSHDMAVAIVFVGPELSIHSNSGPVLNFNDTTSGGPQ